MEKYLVERTRSTQGCETQTVPYSNEYPYGQPTEFASAEDATAKVTEMVAKEYRGRTWRAVKVTTEVLAEQTGTKDEARAQSWGAGASGEGEGWTPDDESESEETDEEPSA